MLAVNLLGLEIVASSSSLFIEESHRLATDFGSRVSTCLPSRYPSTAGQTDCFLCVVGDTVYCYTVVRMLPETRLRLLIVGVHAAALLTCSGNLLYLRLLVVGSRRLCRDYCQIQ